MGNAACLGLNSGVHTKYEVYRALGGLVVSWYEMGDWETKTPVPDHPHPRNLINQKPRFSYRLSTPCHFDATHLTKPSSTRDQTQTRKPPPQLKRRAIVMVMVMG